MKLRCQIGSESLELDDGLLDEHRERLQRLGEAPPVRLVYAAAHVVMHDDYAELETPGGTAPGKLAQSIDWQATQALRLRLAQRGFGIAEAMDTAQRFQIGWSNARRLIEDTGRAGYANGFIAGAGVDHLDEIASEDELVAGVVFQAELIRAAGGSVILLPLAWLTENNADEETYVRVYGRIIESLEGPLFLHWLGAMFEASLEGYFPGHSFRRILDLDPAKVRGAKLSLLDEALERELRRELLTRDQILLSGDDFHFGRLMQGGSGSRSTQIAGRQVSLGDFSHGLLGVFDAIAEPASLALRYLAHGDQERYWSLMQPCELLGRHLFEAPTQNYKCGLAFLAWLNGWQSNPLLPFHLERQRSREHYLQAARLASAAGVLQNAQQAANLITEPGSVSPRGF